MQLKVLKTLARKLRPESGRMTQSFTSQEERPTMDVTYTGRGFEIIKFKDQREIPCELQQSSAIGDYEDAYERPGSSFVWLGRVDERMHLTREQVEELVNRLSNWLEEGTFKYVEEQAEERES
jgi:hypothetical protein